LAKSKKQLELIFELFLDFTKGIYSEKAVEVFIQNFYLQTSVIYNYEMIF